MEKTLKFNSQVATSRVQSERLLALGLKKETADIVHYFSQSLAEDWTIVPLADGETARYIQGLEIPAWSLHRLLLLIPKEVNIDGYRFPSRFDAVLRMEEEDDMYEYLIGVLERTIKAGYFNKEYLV